jgi:hypothetical protein
MWGPFDTVPEAGHGLVMACLVTLMHAHSIKPTLLLCRLDRHDTWLLALPRGVAHHKVGRPLCLAARTWSSASSREVPRRGLVIRFASRGCSVGTWTSALPREVVRQGLGRLLRLARLLARGLVSGTFLRSFLGFLWASRSWVPDS